MTKKSLTEIICKIKGIKGLRRCIGWNEEGENLTAKIEMKRTTIEVDPKNIISMYRIHLN